MRLFRRRYDMGWWRHVRGGHVYFIALTTVVWLPVAINGRLHHQRSYVPEVMEFLYLIVPCQDPVFGNRGPYYWVRQSLFSMGCIGYLLLDFL